MAARLAATGVRYRTTVLTTHGYSKDYLDQGPRNPRGQTERVRVLVPYCTVQYSICSPIIILVLVQYPDHTRLPITYAYGIRDLSLIAHASHCSRRAQAPAPGPPSIIRPARRADAAFSTRCVLDFSVFSFPPMVIIIVCAITCERKQDSKLTGKLAFLITQFIFRRRISPEADFPAPYT